MRQVDNYFSISAVSHWCSFFLERRRHMLLSHASHAVIIEVTSLFLFLMWNPRLNLQRSQILNDCIRMDQKARDYSLKRSGVHYNFWYFENLDLYFSAAWKVERNRDLEIQCRAAVWCKPQVSSTEEITHGILFRGFLHVYIRNQGPRFRIM